MSGLRALAAFLFALIILVVVNLSEQQRFFNRNPPGNPWLQMYRTYQQYQMFGGDGDDSPFGSFGFDD
ncbi:hypothetical protein DPMN_157681 [Dreissena polymorpha]|uniref:Uncharacterized protein n=1 Tax=Dreissena polymorpha TaxID=45954 RepID=A0A9D4EHQ5_DREPO|nr:hypothetical protein DPMN_157681 [Dreissena polymorpha]